MGAIVTVDQIKEYLGIGHSEVDTTISLIRSGVIDDVERICGIKLSRAQDLDDLDGGTIYLRPKKRLPIHGTVISVMDRWTEENYSGTIDNSRTLVWKESGEIWTAGIKRWRVTYTGGYDASDIPDGLNLVLLDMCYRLYHQRGGKAKESARGYAVDWQSPEHNDVMYRLRSYMLTELAI